MMGFHRRCGTVVALAVMLLAIALTKAHAAHDALAIRRNIRHVFIIALENKNYDETFGAKTQAPYLANTLRPMGALLTHYYATGHASLDNYIAMISGQASSLQTQVDCANFTDFHMSRVDANDQAVGDGCVYPASVKTLPDQLKAAGFTWKGYMEDMGNDPAREPATCGHVALNSKDVTQVAEAPSAAVPAGDQYAGRHDPFIYFHSIIDSPDCAANVVRLDTLQRDLKFPATTPNFAFITPNLCNDGHDGDGTGAKDHGCANGAPGGLASADTFLKTWVPMILASSAYQRDGLLIITFDESNYASVTQQKDPATGNTLLVATFAGDSCCEQPIGPNVTRPLTATAIVNAKLTYRMVLMGHGGDRIGAVLLSPFIKPGTVTDVPYNHYSMLKSIEDIFGLGYLGYAGQSGLLPLGPDVYTHADHALALSR